jgi:RNA 2',3'-cyclic 3'-phosphodiesterase
MCGKACLAENRLTRLGLCPSFGLWPNNLRALPEPRAQPVLFSLSRTAGQSHRLTSGGEAAVVSSRDLCKAAMSEEWRTFCAIELPPEVREQLAQHSKQLREAVPDASASWTKPENIHLTLKFFGNVAKDKLALISEAATRVAREFSPFQVRIGGTGVFPRRSRPQVLWIGVEDSSGRLSYLQQRLEEEFAGAGFPKEDRGYRPHLTIARLRRPEDARPLAEAHIQKKFSFIEAPVNEFVLFRSQLSPKGSIYTVISEYRF